MTSPESEPPIDGLSSTRREPSETEPTALPGEGGLAGPSAPHPSDGPSSLSPGTSQATATIPAEMVYWAVVPEGRALTRTACAYRSERVLPVSIDALHWTRAVAANGSVVTIGIEAERLRLHLAQRRDLESCWALVPESLPPAVANQGIPPTILRQLNLLHGLFEPQSRRQLRRRLQRIAATAVLLAGCFLTMGNLRRIALYHQHASELRAATDAVVAMAVPSPDAQAVVTAQDRLTMELRRLEQAHTGHSPDAGVADVRTAVDDVLSYWPSGMRIQIDTATITGNRMIFRGRTTTMADAEHLARTLDAASQQWHIEPVQATTGATGAEFTISAVPREHHP